MTIPRTTQIMIAAATETQIRIARFFFADDLPGCGDVETEVDTEALLGHVRVVNRASTRQFTVSNDAFENPYCLLELR